jgi:hypothetical protein
MPKNIVDSYTCGECRYFKAHERTFAKLNDHQHYLLNGTCSNTRSPLYNRELNRGFTPYQNSEHNRVQTILKAWCFEKGS